MDRGASVIASHSASVPHVLVVDDDLALLEAAATALQRTYRVHTAATGNEASGILRTHPIEAIVLDIMLGDENGLDLVAPFRAHSAARILILTGHSTEELAIRAVWAKVDGYLKKPVDLHQLHEAVTRLVPRDGVPADPLAHIRHYLDTHLEKDIKLDDLARRMGWTERHLRRRFLEVYGKTPGRYLTEARLARAAELLLTTARGLQEIGRKIGCPELGGFRRLFKSRFGVTPSEYRLAHVRPKNRDGTGPDSPAA